MQHNWWRFPPESIMKKLLRRNNNNRQDFKEFNDSTDGVSICKDINDGVLDGCSDNGVVTSSRRFVVYQFNNCYILYNDCTYSVYTV